MQATRKYATLPTEEKVLRIAEWLLEKKGTDLLVLDLSGQQALAEATCIVTATSLRHGQGLADHVMDQCAAHKFERLRVEGHTVGQWILLDLNDVIVHILQPESRSLYRLDDLWTDARVIMDKRKDG